MQEEEINLFDYWKIIWKNRKFIIITVLIVTIVALIISLLLPKWYKSMAVIMPPETEKGVISSLAGSELSSFGLSGMSGSNQSQMRLLTILKSRKMLELLDKEFDFQKKYEAEFKFQTYKQMKSNYEVVIGEEEQIIVSFWDKNQDLVDDIVRQIIHNLDSLNISLSSSQATQQRDFIANRIQLIKDSLNCYENKVAKFMEQNDIISLSEQLKAEVERAAEIKANIMSREIELEVLSKRLKQNSPKIEDLKETIHLLKKNFNDLFDPANSGELFINLDNIPELQKEFGRLKREVLYYSKLLKYLGPQYEQAKIQAAKDIPTIQVIDEPKRPEWKDKPRRALIVVLAMFVSFIITSISVLFYSFIKKMQH